MVFAGHSLGSGVAALLTVVVVNHPDRLGGIPRRLVQCYAIAPARCMSLNLAVKYADVIHSVVLQEDLSEIIKVKKPQHTSFGRLLKLAAHALAEAQIKPEPKGLWEEPYALASSWKPYAEERSWEPGEGSNGYIMITANGGLNQQRVAVCNAVVVARLLNATLVVHKFLFSSVWRDVSCLVDGLEANEPTPGSRSSLGQDLAEITWCRRQETRRHISLASREMWNGLKNPRKIQRIEAYSYSDNLREEIEGVNQKLIDTQVNICDEQHASSGIVIKCLFNGVSVNPCLFKVQPLHLLVPTDYPKCSPILLDHLDGLSGEIGDDSLDISRKARLKLDTFLQDFKNPVTVSEIARMWEVCAREVITELAEKYGGGNFSSRYGAWENCLGSTV